VASSCNKIFFISTRLYGLIPASDVKLDTINKKISNGSRFQERPHDNAFSWVEFEVSCIVRLDIIKIFP